MVNLTRRLGNAKNEIGVLYMKKAAAIMNTEPKSSNEERNLWKKSFSYFESGIRSFEAIDDWYVRLFFFGFDSPVNLYLFVKYNVTVNKSLFSPFSGKAILCIALNLHYCKYPLRYLG